MNETWALLIGGFFGLAASWGPIAFTAQRDRTRHAAATAGRFLSECDRLMRATLERRALVENGRFDPVDAESSFDGILVGLHAAGYELALAGGPRLQAIVYDMLETARELVFATLPAMASEDERRRAVSRFTDRKLELLGELGSRDALLDKRPAPVMSPR